MLIHGGFMEMADSHSPFGQRRLWRWPVFLFYCPLFAGKHVSHACHRSAVSVVRAIGLWKNKMWGFVLSIFNCVITMTLMIFMLPAGIMDGIFACIALLLILTQYYGDKKIIEQRPEMD